MPIHHTVYRDLLKRFRNRGKLSRSHHLQLAKIFDRYTTVLATPLAPPESGGPALLPQHAELLEDLKLALEQAALIERGCELRMEAFRSKDRGNIKLVEKIDWKVQVKAKDRW